jgi:hypothetical protein
MTYRLVYAGGRETLDVQFSAVNAGCNTPGLVNTFKSVKIPCISPTCVQLNSAILNSDDDTAD